MRRFFRLVLAALVGSAVALGMRAMFGPDRRELPAPPVVVAESSVVPTPAPISPALSDPSATRDAEASVYPTGTCWRGDNLFVQMSDGTRRHVRRGRPEVSDAVTQITPVRVIIDGKVERIRPAPRAEVAARQVAPAEVSPALGVVVAEPDPVPSVVETSAGRSMVPGTFAPSSEIGRSSRR